MSDCCLMPTQQFFSYMYIMVKTCFFSIIWWWGSFCTRSTRLSWIFIVLTPRIYMSFHSDTLSWFRGNQFLRRSSKYKCTCVFTVFRLTSDLWMEKQSFELMVCLYLALCSSWYSTGLCTWIVNLFYYYLKMNILHFC